MLATVITVFIVLAICSALILVLLNTKYETVDAECISNDKQSDYNSAGFSRFEYEHDYGRGKQKYYAKLSSVSKAQIGKKYRILIVRQEYNERGIMYADVIKLLIALVILDILLIIAVRFGISGFLS